MDRATIGVDLGGSHVLAAVVDDEGKLHSKHELDIEDHAPARSSTRWRRW
jgi:predicted NBD/HSP70 family sugar kinase